MAASEVQTLIVERERELDALRAALAQGRAGTPGVVLVSGEPGMGKSHLLRSLPVEAGDLVLRGYSLEADSPPYFAFRRAFARLERERGPLATGLAAGILAAAGVLTTAAPGSETPAADPLAVFDALTELLIALATQAPVILVLDDMQWASASAWEAVGYIARAAEGARLALVLASRSEGIEPGTDGAAAVAELSRNGLLRHLPLRPLTPEGTASLAAGTLGSPPAPALTSILTDRTGGNPFFLGEVLRSLIESGALVASAEGLSMSADGKVPVPETLRLAIWQRLARLPEATVDALHAAAVLGRMFELPTLATMLEQPEEWVTGRLRPAARAGVVSEDGGRWSFVHDTLRDAVYEHAAERQAALHRQAASAIARSGTTGASLELESALAHHFREAGDASAAAAAALRASGLALASHASDEALRLAESAADLYFERHGRPPGIAPADVHRAVALAAGAAAKYQRAEDSWASVLELTTDDPERARVLVQLATVARKAERSDAAAEYFQRALTLLEGGTDTRTLIEALVELTTLEGTTRSEYETAISRGERALQLAREVADGALEARAALALANARARGETPVAARPMLSLALERALEVNDLVAAAEASASLSNSYYWAGELRDALVHAERRLEIAERGRDAFALRHAYTWLGMLATSTGDFERARAMIRRAEPAIARMGSPEPLGFLRLVEGLLALRTGQIDLALERTDQAMRIFVPLGEATVSWYVAIRIWTLIAAGRKDEAARECAAQEERLATMPDSALPARSSRCGLGRAYVALGDGERAVACERALAPFADDFHWRPARLTLAAAAAIRGDRARALELLRDVEALEVRNGLEFDLRETRRSISMLAAGEPAQLAFAHPDSPSPERSEVGAPAPGGLSPRELEVLQLVAQGLSNRDIADRLVLSERTVINHVSHVFEKIGVENRAGATAFAFRTGIVARE